METSESPNSQPQPPKTHPKQNKAQPQPPGSTGHNAGPRASATCPTQPGAAGPPQTQPPATPPPPNPDNPTTPAAWTPQPIPFTLVEDPHHRFPLSPVLHLATAGRTLILTSRNIPLLQHWDPKRTTNANIRQALEALNMQLDPPDLLILYNHLPEPSNHLDQEDPWQPHHPDPNDPLEQTEP